jgi:hypothetical protein
VPPAVKLEGVKPAFKPHEKLCAQALLPQSLAHGPRSSTRAAHKLHIGQWHRRHARLNLACDDSSRAPALVHARDALDASSHSLYLGRAV